MTGIEALSGVSEKLIKTLPPAFVMLLVINVLFMGVLAWTVQHNAEARNMLLKTIIDRCLEMPNR